MAEYQKAKLKRLEELSEHSFNSSKPADKSKTLGKTGLLPNPLDNINFFSRVFFTWLNDLVFTGNQRPLENSDFFEVSEKMKSRVLSDRITLEWEKQRKLANPSIRAVLIRVFGPDLLWNLFLGLSASSFRIGQAEMLRFIVASFSDPTATNTRIYCLAMGFALASLFQSLFQQHFMNNNMLNGVSCRVGFISAIYRKVTKLAVSSISSTGQVVNLVSNDVQRLEDAGTYSSFIITSCYECIVVLALVWSTIGPVALFGFATLFLFMVPLQSFFARKFGEIRKKTVGVRDERVRALTDCFNGIQVLKLYAWEEPFEERILNIRARETENLRKASYLKSINDAFFAVASSLMSLATFLPYVALGNQLNAAGVFSTIALYNIIRLSATNFIPKAIEALSESRISLQRIEAFLSLPEIDPESHGNFRSKRPASGDDAIIFNHATFKWPAVRKTNNPSTNINIKKPRLLERLSSMNMTSSALKLPDVPEYTNRDTLADVTFKVKMGELISVVGPVGSGKSSLAMSLLGEIPRQSGSIEVNGRVAYVAQTAWILSGTARDNILFGQPFDAKRYNDVIVACALDRDFASFPNGDLTPIGERGVTLSGGQRARLSLARAIYFNAEVYVLDDPLSAVDTRVARILFEQAIKHLLKDKAVLLITHQLQFAKQADRLFVLDEGQLVACGSYDEVINVDTPYAKVLRSYQENKGGSVDDAAEGVSSKSDEKSSKQEDTKKDGATKSGGGKGGAGGGGKIGIQSEEKASGSVTGMTYFRYFASGGGVIGGFVILPIFTLLALPVAASTTSDWFLSYWTRNPTTATQEYSGIYGGLIGFALIMALIRGFFFYSVCLNSSRSIFRRMLSSVMRTPTQFFIENPVGRVLNRFAKDQGMVDENLPMTFLDFTFCSGLILAIFGVVGSVAPWVLIALVPLMTGFYFVRKYFLTASRDVKRLEAISRSPVYSHVSTTLDGLPTIRAFNLENRFVDLFADYQDQNTTIYATFINVSRWLGIRLDMMTVIFLTLTVFVGCATRNQLSPGAMGLALAYVMQLAGLFQWATRQSTEVENLMVSVERMLAYTKLTPEAERITSVRPQKDWPLKGEIKLNNMTLTYPNTPAPVLKDLSLVIKAGEKVGVVGRTGAGKSSLTLSLFRIVEPTPNGSIMIDDVNCSVIGLKDLRSRLAIIPQEPFLFKGTVRFNLDPNNEHSDDQLWMALSSVELKSVVESLDGKLEANVNENGSNLSAGERQLFCLARAVLRNSRIIVMDECTANVDAGTDKLIQASVRKQFASSTVITIAHRLLTIIDYDRVMVLDAGRLVEFEPPHILLQRSDSYFSQLVAQTGPEMSRQLARMAAEAYDLYIQPTATLQQDASLSSLGIEDSQSSLLDSGDKKKKKPKRKTNRQESTVVDMPPDSIETSV